MTLEMECGTYNRNYIFMSVDVEIYMNNFIRFFKSNPQELISLVPKEKENEFYNKIREVADNNIQDGDEAFLTKKQITEICVELNAKKPIKEMTNNVSGIIIGTKFGNIFLN